jgi:hypothetical protein
MKRICNNLYDYIDSEWLYFVQCFTMCCQCQNMKPRETRGVPTSDTLTLWGRKEHGCRLLTCDTWGSTITFSWHSHSEYPATSTFLHVGITQLERTLIHEQAFDDNRLKKYVKLSSKYKAIGSLRAIESEKKEWLKILGISVTIRKRLRREYHHWPESVQGGDYNLLRSLREKIIITTWIQLDTIYSEWDHWVRYR